MKNSKSYAENNKTHNHALDADHINTKSNLQEDNKAASGVKKIGL